MIFEVRMANASPCHEKLRPALTLYNSGNVLEAYSLAFAEIRKKTDSCELSENDWLLLSTLASAVGFSTKSRAVQQFGHRQNPDSILLAAMYAWDLSAYGRYFECQGLLNQIVDRSPEWKGLILALQSYNYSSMRWDKTGERHHELAIELAGENPLIWFVLSRSAAKRTDWNRAVSEGRIALDLCPTWSRARAALGDSLLSIGEVDEAEQVLSAETIPSIRMSFSRAMCCQATHKTIQAIKLLAELAQTWPRETKIAKYSVRQLTLLLMQQGQLDAVEILVDEFNLEEFQIKNLQERQTAKQKHISMPLVSQTRNHCVPTLAAMVAGSQGVDATPKQYADGMETRHGTPLWRMVDFMKSQGFRAICVRPEVNIIKAMLDQNVPLIGELTHVFSGHVDCVCGYDDRLELFYLRDPMHWHGSSIKFDELSPRYRGSASLWAMVAPHRIEEVTINDDWENLEGQALIDLSRACCQGERIAAEQAYAKIPDESPLAFQRDGIARSVVLTGQKYQARVRAVVDGIGDDDKVEYNQIRALLQLIDEENADQLLELAKQNLDKLSRTFVKYVEAQCLYAKNLWQEALVALTDVCHLWPSLDSLWSQLAQVQQQLGMADEARKSLAIAMEVAPDQGQHQTSHLNDRESDIPFDQRLAAATALVDQFPDSPSTRLTVAQVMVDTASGVDYEQALRDAIRFFPRYDWPYHRLAHWYLGMARGDLSHAVLQEARELMGLEEIPFWSFEIDNHAFDTASEVLSEDQSEALREQIPDSSDESEFDNSLKADAAVELQSGNSSKYFQLWSEATQGFELSHADFEDLEAVKGLVQLDAGRQLHWWQSVRVLSLRISNLFNDQTVLFSRKNSHRANSLKDLLPKSVPGVAECYVLEFIENFQLDHRPHDCLNVLLAWMDSITPNRGEYARLCFQRAYLLELIGRYNESEEQLKRIVENHSAHYGSYYRLGQISYRRGDLAQARAYFNQCLEVSPGNSGSLEALIDIAERMGADTLDLRVRLWELQPYSHRCLYNVAYEYAMTQGADAGHKFIDQQHSYFDASRFPVIKARLCVATKQYDEAASLIATMPDDGPDYSAEWILVDCALARNEFQAVADQVAKMLEQWPHDQDLMDQMARALRELDLNQAKAFSKKKLLEGHHVQLLAYVALENEPAADEVAIRLLQQTKLEFRDDLANTLIDVLRRQANAEQCLEFMKFCRARLPHLRNIRRMLAYDLFSTGQIDEAVELAQELVHEQPENPEYLECIGYCLQESQPLRAIGFLEKAFEFTGKMETLSDLARTYQIQGDESKAKELHWKTLELDPYNTVAMTNLNWQFAENSVEMLDRMLSTFDCKGSDFGAEYFLVTVADLAQQHQKPLPPDWLKHALDRAMSIQKYGGFHDEGAKLGSYLEIWLDAWKQAEDSQNQPQDREATAIWVPEKPVDFEYPSGAGEDGIEALGIALSISGTLPSYLNEQHDQDSIGRHVQAGEACMSRQRWSDAEQNFRAAIDIFDESVSQQERRAVVRRLLDAKKKGALMDHITRFLPVDPSNQSHAIGIGIAIAMFAGVFMYSAKSIFGESTEFTVITALSTLLFGPPSLYYFVRWWESKTLLDEIEQQKMIERAVFGKPHQKPVSSEQSESVVSDEIESDSVGQTSDAPHEREVVVESLKNSGPRYG